MKNEEKRKKALTVYVIGGMMEKKNAKMPGIIANFFKNIREKRVSARIQRKHNVYLSAPCLFCYLNCFCNGIITGAGMYVGFLQGKKKKFFFIRSHKYFVTPLSKSKIRPQFKV